MPDQKAFFWVDWLGFLWYGPLPSGDYNRFEGVNAELAPIWELRSLDDWAMPMDLCPYRRAAFAVNMFVQHAKGMRRR